MTDNEHYTDGTDRFELHFECCGNVIPLGFDRNIGSHGDHCLACDTANPPTSVVRGGQVYADTEKEVNNDQ